jgi:peptide-methionine (R)-S-oxide reductase
MNRRTLLATAAAFLALPHALRAETETFEINLTEAEWRARLTEMQYYVLREEGTERAGTSPLDKVYDPGTYHCAGCDLAAFSSETKYDSGTGWPSFWEPLPNATRTKPDPGIFGSRTEVHCRRCGGHFGHVFDDGPAPTGQRWCMNGAALVFKAA